MLSKDKRLGLFWYVKHRLKIWGVHHILAYRHLGGKGRVCGNKSFTMTFCGHLCSLLFIICLQLPLSSICDFTTFLKRGFFQRQSYRQCDNIPSQSLPCLAAWWCQKGFLDMLYINHSDFTTWRCQETKTTMKRKCFWSFFKIRWVFCLQNTILISKAVSHYTQSLSISSKSV